MSAGISTTLPSEEMPERDNLLLWLEVTDKMIITWA